MECSPRKAASGIPARAASAARHGRGYKPKRPSLKRRQPWRRPMPTPDPPATLAAALAELQTDLPRIPRTAHGQVGTRRYTYPPYDQILRRVRPVLAKHRFMWRTQPTLTVINDETRFVLAYSLTYL